MREESSSDRHKNIPTMRKLSDGLEQSVNAQAVVIGLMNTVGVLDAANHWHQKEGIKKTKDESLQTVGDMQQSGNMKVNTYPFWIKERYNPQLGTYYVQCGQLSKTAAKKKEGSIYGSNVMLRFETEAEYQAKLADLKKRGERVQ